MDKPLIAITMGDPSGIGPEIIAKTFLKGSIYDICKPIVLGDLYALRKVLSDCNINININKIEELESACFEKGRIDLLALSNISKDKFVYGKFVPELASSIIEYIKKAVNLALENKVSAIVTGPINKSGLIESGFKFKGHTDFLAHLSNTNEYAMMLASDRLKVTLVTVHCPFSEVVKNLTKEKIVSTIKLTYNFLKKYISNNPKIAVLGLNPHCGEDGKIGKEEIEIIIPAIEEAKKYGIDLYGPKPADTLFHFALLGYYDAVVCMYHDQGLIPIKLVDFYNAVNLTLGLPFIRTSVDHGVAYDIAGEGKADFRSLEKAIEWASKLATKK